MTEPGGAIRLEGAKEFRRALRDAGDDMEDLKATHKDAAEIVARRAAVISPARPGSGMLRDSVDSRGTKTQGYVRAGGRNAIYAGVIHFGWPARNIRPQPFLHDALDQRRSEVLDVYDDRVAKIARKRGID